MYQSFRIGQHFRILPQEEVLLDDGLINLVMARGAFGSGEHETTASCLELLEGLPAVADANLLDLGSGTGILAIGALKLGARRAVCLDISPDAVQVCRHNCEANQVIDQVRHITGSLDTLDEDGFDLVLANIYGDLLIDFATNLVTRVRPGGWLLLSGILWEYNFDVRQNYEKLGCRVEKNRMLKEFSTLLLQKG